MTGFDGSGGSVMPLTLRVNGTEHQLSAEPRTTLADALRDGLGLTGTRLGCEHGVCGSCTVLVDGAPARSCLLLAVQCAQFDIRTVEGLATEGTLHPLQRAFAEEHALQCGFCTPGFLMTLAGELAATPDLDADERRLEEVLASNLCRCTGYEGIRRATISAARRMRAERLNRSLRDANRARHPARRPPRAPATPRAGHPARRPPRTPEISPYKPGKPPTRPHDREDLFFRVSF